jgi:sugar diacid utilization regulator
VIRQHAQASDVPTGERDEALAYLTRAVFTYQDFVTSRAADNYARVEAALGRSKARVQQQLIREMLAGGSDVLPTPDLLLLDYDIHSHHVAILLTGTGEDAAVRLAGELRAATRIRDSLVYRLSMDTSVVWLGSPSEFSSNALDAIHHTLLRAGCRAAIGDVHAGLTGLVTSFRQAEQTDRVAGHGTEDVVRYCDVMLDILLLQDRVLAESFVRRVLGVLADDTSEAARLRATMDASLRHSTHVAAAEELEVHEHTVRNRLARIEDILGPGLRERRTEIEVALRLRRTLQGEQSSPGG